MTDELAALAATETEAEDRESRQAADLTRSLEQSAVGESDNNSILMDARQFNQAFRVARLMASGSLLPRHLTHSGSQKAGWKPLSEEQVIGNCFRIVNHAIRWDMDPFAIVDETYFVNGHLAFQGKLIAAVVNTRANLVEPLTFTYAGEGDGRVCTVGAAFKGSPDKFRTLSVELKTAKTAMDIWKTQPDQKLAYTAAIRWARRHCPEVIFGIHIIEEEQPEVPEKVRLPGETLDDLIERKPPDKPKGPTKEQLEFRKEMELAFSKTRTRDAVVELTNAWHMDAQAHDSTDYMWELSAKNMERFDDPKH